MLSSNRTSTLDARLGQRIRAFRLRRGDSVLSVAMRLGISPTTYKQIEDGATHIKASQLLILSQALGVNLADFYDGLLD